MKIIHPYHVRVEIVFLMKLRVLCCRKGEAILKCERQRGRQNIFLAIDKNGEVGYNNCTLNW